MPLNRASKTPTWLGLLLRLVVAAVFAAAAIPKLADPGSFAEAIQNYRLFPDAWAPVLASVVPVLELVTCLALLSPWAHRGGALVVAGMLVFFSAAIAQAIVRGIAIDCGCFGQATPSTADWTALVRNGLLLLAAAAILLSRPGSGPEKATDKLSGTPTG